MPICKLGTETFGRQSHPELQNVSLAPDKDTNQPVGPVWSFPPKHRPCRMTMWDLDEFNLPNPTQSVPSKALWILPAAGAAPRSDRDPRSRAAAWRKEKWRAATAHAASHQGYMVSQGTDMWPKRRDKVKRTGLYLCQCTSKK